MLKSKAKIDGVTVEVTDMWIQGGDLYVEVENKMSQGTKTFQVMAFNNWVELETGEEYIIREATE